jgi:hypothetical protein
VRRAVLEILSLSNARRVISARTPERHAEIRRWWAAARARLGVAARLDPEREQLAAVPLYREGLRALAGAAVASAEGNVKPEDVADLDAAWAALERVWPALGIPEPLSDFAPARDVLREPVAIDAPPRPVGDTIATLDRLSRLVERAIEPRSLKWLTWRARIQVGAIALAVVALLALKVPPLFAPKDLALHKPVKISSSHPDSLAPSDGSWLDNGRVEHVYGAHTTSEDNPWMQIDLERPTAIGRVVVYNRGDGWLTDCLPLELAVGDDESKLRPIARREALFTQFHPWVVQTNQTVRFLRLTKRGHGTCALSEVEVFAK